MTWLRTVSKHKGDKESGFLSQQQRFQCVIESKVAATIDDDSDTRDNKAAIQTDKAVWFDRFDVHVNHSIELSLSSLMNTAPSSHESDNNNNKMTIYIAP